MNPETDDLDLLEGLEGAPFADDVENDDPAPQPDDDFQSRVDQEVERLLALRDRVERKSAPQAPQVADPDDDDITFDWVDPNAALRALKAEIRELKSQKADPNQYLEVYGAKQEAMSLVDSIVADAGVPASAIATIKEQIRNAPIQQSDPNALKAFAEAAAKAVAYDALRSRPAPRVNRNSYGVDATPSDYKAELAQYPVSDRKFLINQHAKLHGKPPTAQELLEYLKEDG